MTIQEQKEYRTLDQANKKAIDAKSVAELNAEVKEAQHALKTIMALGEKSVEGETRVDYAQAAKAEGRDRSEADLRVEANNIASFITYAQGAAIDKSNAEKLESAAGAVMPSANVEQNHEYPVVGSAKNPMEVLEQITNTEPLADRFGEGKIAKGTIQNFGGVGVKKFLNVVSTTAGISVDRPRNADMVYQLMAEPTLAETLPSMSVPNGTDSFSYPVETAVTNAVAGRSEGSAAANQNMASTNSVLTVQHQAVFATLTEDFLKFVPMAQAFATNVLSRNVRNHYGNQVINGNGTAPNMNGLVNITGAQTQTKQSTDKLIETYAESFKKVREKFGQPSVVAMGVGEWHRILLVKDTDNRYLWGDTVTGMPDRIWGVPVLIDYNIADNTAITLDRSAVFIAEKDGIELEFGTNSDDFQKYQLSMRVGFYANVGAWRPDQIVKLAALNS